MLKILEKNGEDILHLKGCKVEDAKRAIDIGCTGVIVSNHGGRQLDGSVSPFDQLAKIVDAVGDKIDVICEGEFKEEHIFLKLFLLVLKPVQVEALFVCFSFCR